MKSIEAENNYREWLKSNPEAKAKVDSIIETGSTIPNLKNRNKYYEQEKRDLDKKYIPIYANEKFNKKG